MKKILFLLAGCLLTVANTHAQPIGKWDCVISGSGQSGLAVIEFSDDGSGSRGTLRGYELLAPKTKGLPNPSRGTDKNGGRDDIPKTGGGITTVLFGFGSVSGTWSIDAQGKLFGFLTENANRTQRITNYSYCIQTNISDGTCATNLNECFTNSEPTFVLETPCEDYTFLPDSFTVTEATIEVINAVSFTGKVVPGRRLTLVGASEVGTVTFKGVPLSPQPDLTGSWLGVKRQEGVSYNEFFDLISFGVDNPFPEFPDVADFPNIYFSTNGIGGGYSFIAVSMIGQKQIGFVAEEEINGLRATVGKYRAKNTLSAKSAGIISPATPIRFDATQVSVP